MDENGLPTAKDLDGDNVHNDCDSCPEEANPLQLDSDEDGEGNVCDETPDGGEGEGEIDPEVCCVFPGEFYSVGMAPGSMCDGTNYNDGFQVPDADCDPICCVTDQETYPNTTRYHCGSVYSGLIVPDDECPWVP